MYIGVVGAGAATEEQLGQAQEVGRLLAEQGHVVVCGGLGGVMEAAALGARVAGGVVVGILPGEDRAGANPYLTVAIPTGLGELRNGLVVRASDAVICLGGDWGTISEVALALRSGVPVITLADLELPGGPLPAASAAQAVDLATS